MPILADEIPHVNQSIIAEQAMAKTVHTLKSVDTVENVLHVL